MKFDSHVETLLAAAVGLVNLLTPGHDGTSEVEPPVGRALAASVSDVLVSQGRRSRVTAVDADRLRDMAVRLREVFGAADRGDVNRAAVLINGLLEQTSARPRLDRFDDGWSLHFHGPDDGVVVGWSAGFASALALCVGSDHAGRLGVCEASPCDRVYVDASKNGTRRFCSTRCQSRVKAAAHRSRHP
ncbi:MAG: CGNR zinc finger domain-containing protein [Lapillicoccus sp.]